MRRRPSSRWIWFGPSDSSTVARWPSGTAPRCGVDQHAGQPSRVRADSQLDERRRSAAEPVDHLGDTLATGQQVDALGDARG